jgi:hypothetical protein
MDGIGYQQIALVVPTIYIYAVYATDDTNDANAEKNRNIYQAVVGLYSTYAVKSWQTRGSYSQHVPSDYYDLLASNIPPPPPPHVRMQI